MKKLGLLLLILWSGLMSAQVIVHNQPVKLKQVVLGVQADSLLVVSNDGLINYLPISSIQISPEVAIISLDEGNGETFFPQNFSRDFKGVGGQGALDMSAADGVGGYGSLNGALGSQSVAIGYNVKNEGYGAFILGQDADIPSSGTYAFNLGTDNSIGGYQGIGIGTFLTNTTNYGIQFGHSIDFTSGGLNVGIGFGLSETTALSDRVAIFGQGNKEPIDSEGFDANNIGMIIGSGDLTGNGSAKFVRVTPRNSVVVFRDALAGLVNLEASTLANLKIWDDTFPHAAATVEYVQDAVAGAGVTKLPWLSSTAAGEYTWEVDGETFAHNYTGNTSSPANPWYKNTFIGVGAGNYAVGDGTSTPGNGDINVGIGSYALNALTTGTQNVMIGSEAGALMTTAGQNVGIGDGAFYFSVSNVSNNMGIGKNVFQNLIDGDYNAALGRNSGFYINAGGTLTSGDHHTLIGQDTRVSANGTVNEIVIGSGGRGGGSNTAVIGSAAITKVSAGADYVAVNPQDLITKGYADATYTGGDVSIVKFVDNTGVLTDNLITMNGNTFLHNFGSTALTWEKNLFVGENAGNLTMTGNTNGFVGNDAGSSLTTGAENYGFGNETLALTTTGGMNTAFGSAAGYSNVGGIRNAYFGRQSGVWVVTGDNNAMFGSTSGFTQVAGGNLTSISEATLFGSYTDGTQGSTNETAIGYSTSGNGSNTVTIGNNAVTDFYVGADPSSGAGYEPAYWSDNYIDTPVRVRPNSGGFDVETTQPGAFGGGTDKMRLVSSASSTENREGGIMFQGANGESVWLRFETDSGVGEENGIDFFIGDYFNGRNTRWENIRPELTIDPSTNSADVLAMASSQIRVWTTALAKTITIVDTMTNESGQNITYINAGTAAVTIATGANVTINGSSAFTYEIAPMTNGEVQSVQLIHLEDGTDDYILIGAYTKI